MLHIKFVHVFQFHKGTIRTYAELKTSFDRYKFQFHKGTIRTQYL